MIFPLVRQQCDAAEEAFPYLFLTLISAICVFGLEMWLVARQLRCLRTPGIPNELKTVLSELDEEADSLNDNETSLAVAVEEKHEDTAKYNIATQKFGIFCSVIDLLHTSVIVLLGAYVYAWQFAARLANYVPFTNALVQPLLLISIFAIYSMVFNIPIQLYRTFVLEEKYGFNNTTLATFFMDKLKSILLFGVLGLPITALILWLLEFDHFDLFLCGCLLTVSLGMMWVYPNLIAPLFNKFDPLEEGPLKEALMSLAESVNFPLKKLYVVDGSRRSGHSNAYLFGLWRNKRIVLYDTLLKQCQCKELLAVVAHELGHWSHSHIAQMIILQQANVLLMLKLFGYFVKSQPMYMAFGFCEMPRCIGLILFVGSVYAPLSTAISFMMTFLLRRIEEQADRYAVTLGYGRDLMKALVRLSLENMGALRVDRWYSLLNHSHPPITVRLESIREAMVDESRKNK